MFWCNLRQNFVFLVEYNYLFLISKTQVSGDMTLGEMTLGRLDCKPVIYLVICGIFTSKLEIPKEGNAKHFGTKSALL